ncbi:hypothetical protein A8C32_12720 [Flavivirga aquatica]|uniref:Alpha/beta hydrolase n=1 Tax=Flavivirga aquatica TaxID=1849968 RepID=A0A1E5TDW8_9FLAO|nr:hypothetical protein [Flavivirga aquatica]OEK09560.1 hypothetical protein A8C32_12720 [Flavivirga aquatica]
MKKNVFLISTTLILVCSCFINLFAQNSPIGIMKIIEGSGSFQITGGAGHENDTITVYYHKPKNFTPKSKVLMIIPGSGRNGDSYRDSWIKTSEKHSVLILSPAYAKKDYSYLGYHLGGIAKDRDIKNAFTFVKNSNQVIMDEEKAIFEYNDDARQWIYPDFDRIFNLVKNRVKSQQKKYDMFGHSAGGQILHRFVLMHPNSKADRILASNAGSYTLPDMETNYPCGIKNVNHLDLKKAFKKRLVLFLGELDNANENGGILLRSITTDKQGLHRLARGKYFYQYGLKISKDHKNKFNWTLKVIPNVGHNQRKMAKAAAVYLYEND